MTDAAEEAPGPPASGGLGADPLGERIQAVAYGVAGHLSAAQRTAYAAQLHRGSLARLTAARRAWSGVAGLDRDTFRQRFLDPHTSDEVVDRLRRAAQGVAQGRTHEELRDAAGDLAAAIQTVGLDRWPRFVADAQERAASQPPISGKTLSGLSTLSRRRSISEQRELPEELLPLLGWSAGKSSADS